MIPILYEKTETAFTSNGLGRLSSCISCRVTEERNGIFECQFEFPVSDPMFGQIEEGRIIGCTHDEQGDVQPFDIYGRSEPINGVVTFYAHHISYRLNEITVKPFTAGSCVEALSKIRTQSVNANPFTFWTNKSVTSDFVSEAPRNAKRMLSGEEGSILDIYGTGEYEFDKFNVRLYLHRGQDTNVSIRYGKNLIDYTNDYDVSESYTSVVPYWLGDESEGEESVSTLVMLPELFISSGQSVPSGREVVVPMDMSDAFEEPPTVAQLRSAATSRLTASQAWLPNQTVKVNFVQLWQTEEYKEYAPLQRLRLCDTCGVFVPMYGTALRAKVIRVVYNVLLDRYDEMELGDKPTTYTAIIEKMYNSKVAGVVAGLQSLAVDIETAQNIAEANAKAYSDVQLSEAVLAINADIADLQDQIDGNITTWFFSTDPSMNTPPVAYDPNVEGSGWDTDAKKKEHLGDLYYNTSTGYAWRFVYENGAYSWSVMSDSGVAEALRLASEAKDIADSKRRIFYTEPVPPYDDGDLWTQGENGDILRCATPKAEGETYSRSDWILASKYTDNSALYAFIQGTFADTVTSIEGQLDRKAETWYQSTDPSINWQTAEQKADHIGDLWYYTGDTTSTFSKNATYRWDGTAWQPQTIPESVFDMIDGKSQIFVGATQPTGAENGDLWFQGPDKPILTRLNGAWLDYNYYIDSSISQAQADQAEAAAKDYADSAVSGLRTDLETQIDAKIETWAQASDPQTDWTDKAAHNGDLWLYTGLTDIVVNGQTIRPQGVYQYAAFEGGTLCNESDEDLTDENDVVLEAIASGDWSPYASTSDNLFDLADGKSTIYYGSPTGSYSDVDSGDYLVDSSTGMTYRYQGGAWVKQTDYKTYTDNEISSAKTTIQDQYEQAIDDATELIRGGTGGYVVTTVNADGQPIELLITDNMNLNQAVNVWRWNQGGLAHSSNGYNGPFNDVAITADGKINASMILTGALTANLITAGTIASVDGLNTWNLDSGQLVAKKGSIGGYTISSTKIEHTDGTDYARLDADGISFKYNGSNGVYTYYLYTGQSGLRLCLKQTGSGSAVDAPQITPNRIKNSRNNTYYVEATINCDNAIRLGDYSTNIAGTNPLTVFVNESAFIGGDSATSISESVLMQDGLYVLGTLEVNGTKNRVVKTDNYSNRLLYCYETPTPLFGDIGEAQLDADGICYVDLDDIFTETIAEQVEYQVFLQKEGEGDCWVSEKAPRYFVIEGTPNLKVAWELKAKQKDYHNIRLELSGKYLDEYERINDDLISLDNYITEQEELLYG